MEEDSLVGNDEIIYWQEPLMMSSYCYALGYQVMACGDFNKVTDDPLHLYCYFVLISP